MGRKITKKEISVSQRPRSQANTRTYGIVAALAVLSILGTIGEAAAQSGTAIVQVESKFDHPDVQISFFGAFQGTVGLGGTLRQADLVPGAHSIGQPAISPWLTLVAVTCDDQQSAVASTGSVAMRAANFHIEEGETVTCTFVYDAFERFMLPDELPPGFGDAFIPLEGIWGVTNLGGSIQCPGLMSRDLTGDDYNQGTLTVHEAGARLFGEAHDDDAQDMMMFRVPTVPGRYNGWAVERHEGQNVLVYFAVQFITEELMVGYGAGDMRAEGVHCRLYRPFEMRWEDPLPDDD